MMIQTATNESSNTTEEGSSSSEVESQPIHGRGSLVQQVARRVESYMRFSGVSDAIIAHPGRYYGVLRSTRVVPVIFRRQNSNAAGVKYKN